MELFARQEIIPGWRQAAIRESRVLVAGRGWAGCSTVWGLSSLGVGEILWLGLPDSATESFARFLIDDHAPGLGGAIHEYLFDPQRNVELGWIFSERRPTPMVAATGNELRHLLADECSHSGSHFVAVTAGDDRGSVERRPSYEVREEGSMPVSLLAAALAVDEIVMHLGSTAAGDRDMGKFVLPAVHAGEGVAVVVGIGAVGVYAATALAGHGVRLALIDFDTVETVNLNRQGLFTTVDASEGRFKALAAANRISKLFPLAAVTALTEYVTVASANLIGSLGPSVIVSCVDNAVSRLVLSQLGRELSVPVVQAGTDLYSADCYTQVPGGAALDAQMFGACPRQQKPSPSEPHTAPRIRVTLFPAWSPERSLHPAP